MEKKICAVLLSLCSVIGGAERKSDASIVGKVLKYVSAAVGALDTLGTIDFLSRRSRIYEFFGGSPKVYLFYNVDDRYEIRVLIAGTVLNDLFCYGSYKLGQYLDGDIYEKENLCSFTKFMFSHRGGQNENLMLLLLVKF